MNPTQKFLIPVALGISLSLAGAANAAETDPAATAEPAAKTAPAKRAGRTIDVAQAQARADQVFAAADKDGNGEVSREEFEGSSLPGARQRRGEPGMGAPWMGGAATDEPRMGAGMGRGMRPGMGPGMPSAEDRAAFHKELFVALDTDGNGQLSAAEFDRQHEATQELFRKHAFDRLDANADGVLTKDELPSQLERLKAADADNDGQVTAEEMRAARRSGTGTTKAP